MRYILLALLFGFGGLFCGIVTAGVAAVLLSPPRPMKLYRATSGSSEKPFEIHADRIELRHGCVLFLRGDVVDTILCDGMARLIVTDAGSQP